MAISLWYICDACQSQVSAFVKLCSKVMVDLHNLLYISTYVYIFIKSVDVGTFYNIFP
jgi:hypothetical protein